MLRAADRPRRHIQSTLRNPRDMGGMTVTDLGLARRIESQGMGNTRPRNYLQFFFVYIGRHGVRKEQTERAI